MFGRKDKVFLPSEEVERVAESKMINREALLLAVLRMDPREYISLHADTRRVGAIRTKEEDRAALRACEAVIKEARA